VGRTIAMVVFRVVEAIFGAKKQAANTKNHGQCGQNQLNIHRISSEMSAFSMANFRQSSNFLKDY
jgi:hypothetical protein